MFVGQDFNCVQVWLIACANSSVVMCNALLGALLDNIYAIDAAQVCVVHCCPLLGMFGGLSLADGAQMQWVLLCMVEFVLRSVLQAALEASILC